MSSVIENLRFSARTFRDDSIAAIIQNDAANYIEQLQRERDELVLELSESGRTGYKASEYNCVMLNLTDAGVPTSLGDNHYSLWGRIDAYIAELQAKAVEDAIESTDINCDAVEVFTRQLFDYADTLRKDGE